MPLWWRRKRPSARALRWAEFAAELEAQPTPAAAERVRRFLDLEGAEVLHLHTVRHSGEPTVFVFDVLRRRVGPAGQAERWSSWALVRSDRPIAPVSFRASPRRPSVLESLAASRAGASAVDLSARPEVAAALSVLAREPQAVQPLLRDVVLDTLQRMLALAPGVEVVVGQRHLMASAEVAEGDDPSIVMPLASELLLLSTLLQGAGELPVAEADFVDLGAAAPGPHEA